MTQRTAVAVLGARGRMGSEVCRAVESSDDLELAASIDVEDPLDVLVECDASVAVHFTPPDVVLDQVRFCVENGVHCVVGTTGWDDERLATLRDWLTRAPGVGIVVAPNFGVGAILMMRFAREAARFYESVEVVELHHPGKVDAPSGTARRTAEVVAAARRRAGLAAPPDATTQQLDGARGAVVDGIHVHAVRLRGLVAHQEVLLGAAGETLSIRHDSLDRASFMPGVLLGVRRVSLAPGLTVGLERFLGLD